MSELNRRSVPPSDEVATFMNRCALPAGEVSSEVAPRTYEVVEMKESEGGYVIQTTKYELDDMDERFDDGKRIKLFMGVSEAGRLALVNVVRVADGLQMWATAPTEEYKELFRHPSQFVSPGEASLMWASGVEPSDGWRNAA